MSTSKLSLVAAGVIGVFAMSLPTQEVEAANWLQLQGTEKTGTAGRAKLWGFVQPEFIMTDGTGNPNNANNLAFNLTRPNLKTRASFNIRRARIGVRGQGFPLDNKTNYFLLAEFGNNGVTNGGGGKSGAKITDASITLNHIPFARIRVGQFKYPGSEEGLQAIHVFDYVNFTNMSDRLLLERFTDNTGDTGINGPVGAFRDIGVQVFDWHKVGGFEVAYAGMVGNGNGIGRTDNNGKKDFYEYLSVTKVLGGKGGRRQEAKFYGWAQQGERTFDGALHDRTRSGAGVAMRYKKYRFGAEYVMADGMIFNGRTGASSTGAIAYLTDDKATGWYVDVGYKVMPKLELDVRYDTVNSGTEAANAAVERTFTTTTIGAQYFVNKKTRITLNYELRSAEGPGAPAGVVKVLDSIDDRISIQMLAIF